MKVNRNIGQIVAVVLAAATFVGLPSLAQAATGDHELTQIVTYGDLKLPTEAGVRALYLRIQTAARDVCEPATRPGSRILSQDWKDCVSTAVQRAIRTVAAPRLTDYYATQLRKPVSRSAS